MSDGRQSEIAKTGWGRPRNRGAPVIWLTVIALFSPYSLAIFLGDLKLTPAKLLITLLVIPATGSLLAGVAAGRRRLLFADLLAVVATGLMVGAPVLVVNESVFVGAASQALEFFGSYALGRAFFFGVDALRAYTRVLAAVLLAVTGFAILDVITGHFVVAETLAAVFSSPGGILSGSDPHFHRMIFGVDVLRATSTFDHPILFGAFCAVTAAILAYAPFKPSNRVVLLGVSVLGCVIALSSASVLSLVIVIGILGYNWLFSRAAWRWKALMVGVGAAIGLLYVLSDSPKTWMIRHLTLDPSTGYFRLLMWDAAFDYIGDHAWIGSGFQPTGVLILDNSVDSMWIGKMLNYGIPAVTVLFLLVISVLTPARGQIGVRRRNVEIDRLCIGLSLAVVLFNIIGLTVYFWNGVWLYFALCLGVRASLKEYCLINARRRVLRPRRLVDPTPRQIRRSLGFGT